MITRQSYQDKRFALLSMQHDLAHLEGLEIGACDLPVVRPDQGLCRHADFRSADEMSHLWNIPRDRVCEVEYVISRDHLLADQISRQFDYVVACHVIEHVPDPIGYIADLAELVRDGGRIMLAVPDKRSTPDRSRPSTSIDHLLMDYHDKCRYPSVEHIMEFHRHWMSDQLGYDLPIAEAYEHARTYHASGEADVHCHVWTDEEFRNQIVQLIEAGIISNLSLDIFEDTPDGYNEFALVLRKLR